ADVVQSPRQREASIFGNQAMGWFQTDESTGGRRNTDRASGVCTECGKGHIGCNRSAGATRGSARYFIEIPWIMDRAKVRAVIVNAPRVFVHVELAHQHNSRFFHA